MECNPLGRFSDFGVSTGERKTIHRGESCHISITDLLRFETGYKTDRLFPIGKAVQRKIPGKMRHIYIDLGE
jgi:hypothetical protein